MQLRLLRGLVALTAALAFLVILPRPAIAAGNPEVAALQVGLRAKGLYRGTIDGVLGPGTEAAVRRFQQKAGLVADGVAGRKTRVALGRYGRQSPFGRRTLTVGMRGWDVAALQFSLAWHGFPSGPFDGHLGARTQAAVARFQRWAGMDADGTAGPSTIAALRTAPPRSPLSMQVPVQAPLGDLYGPRGDRFHSGLDFPAPSGTTVSAAASGRVVYAQLHGGGWGRLVVIAHSSGVRTFYAHLSRIDVSVGRTVAPGATIGAVGATGNTTGPHLHFEVLVRGAGVDPQTAF